MDEWGGGCSGFDECWMLDDEDDDEDAAAAVCVIVLFRSTGSCLERYARPFLGWCVVVCGGGDSPGRWPHRKTHWLLLAAAGLAGWLVFRAGVKRAQQRNTHAEKRSGIRYAR